MQILYVCTANICRSPSAAAIMIGQVRAHSDLYGIEVSSAGVRAREGSQGCARAPALQPEIWRDHRSRAITREALAGSELILAATREQRDWITAIDPNTGNRCFTVLEAGRIANWLTQPGGIIEQAWFTAAPASTPTGTATPDALPEPVDREQRWSWLVGELDAARVLVPTPDTPKLRGRNWLTFWRPATDRRPSHPDDLIDPHEEGTALHEPVFEQIREATLALATALLEVADPDPSR